MRDIVEDHSFDRARALLGIDIRRLDEILEGLTFTLARNPELFERVPGTYLRVALTTRFPDVPALRVFFTVDAQRVTLVAIEERDEPSAEEDARA